MKLFQRMDLNLFLTENNSKFDSFSNNFKELHKVLRGLPAGNKKTFSLRLAQWEGEAVQDNTGMKR